MPPVLRRRAPPPPLPSPSLTESLPTPPPKPLSPHLQKLDEIFNIMLNTFTIEADWLSAKAIAKALFLLHGKKADLPPSLHQWRQKRTDWSRKASTVLATATKRGGKHAATLAALHSGADLKLTMIYRAARYDALSCAVLEYARYLKETASPMTIGKNNKTARVITLLQWGADPFGNHSGPLPSAMEIALRHKLFELPKFLLCRDRRDDQGKVRLTKECRDRKNALGETTLQMAIKYKGNLAFVSWLIARGADTRTSDNGGNTILHTLAQQHPYDCVTNTRYWDLFTKEALRRLLEVRNNKLETPLLAACRCSRAFKLMELGADITVTNLEGDTILHRLARMDLSPQEWKELVNLGADFFSSIINQPNNKGKTPLLLADIGNIPHLVNMGADINAVDGNGNNVLHLMAPFWNRYTGKSTLPASLSDLVNKKNNDGFTPLLLVRHSERAKMYLQLGADINATDEEGNTAFHLAAAGNKAGEVGKRYADSDASMLQSLFNAGGPALLEKKNKAGETAVTLAYNRRWLNKPLKSIVRKMDDIVAAAAAAAAAEKKRKEEEDAKPKAAARPFKKRKNV